MKKSNLAKSMTIQNAITKAIEGGWDVHDSTLEELRKSWGPQPGRERKIDTLVELIWKENQEKIFLDPLFWQSLYGSEKYGRIKAIEFINAIFDGKSAEKFFEQESDLGKEQQEKALS